jgi:hypothetical protein
VKSSGLTTRCASIATLAFVLMTAFTIAVSAAPSEQTGRPEGVSPGRPASGSNDRPSGDLGNAGVRATVQPTKAHDELTDEQKEKEEKSLDRKWARGQVVATAVVAILSLLVLGTQLTIMDKQRELMANQNSIMEGQTTSMNALLVATGIAANAATRNANAAVMAVEHADRPWIRVYLTPETLTTSDTEGLQIRSGVTVKNVGKSVAEQVVIWNYLAVDPSTLAAEQEKLRASFDKPELGRMMGMTIFPGEEKTQIHTVGTGKESPESFWRERMPVMLDRDLGERILPLTYIGCVGYRYGTSDKWHFTYWGYDLVLSDGRHLPLHIATGKLPQPPFLREPFLGNLNRAT